MYIDDFYKFAQFALKKDNKGNCTPDQFNMAYNMASQAQFIQRYGLPQDYRHGMAQPKIAYALTQKIEDDLRPFKQNIPLFPNPKTGQVPIPTDYSHYIKITKKIKRGDGKFRTSSIDVMTGITSPSRLESQILPVEFNPICEFENNYIQFYPEDILSIQMTYLSIPPTATWAFTTPNGRTPQFDPTTSIDTVWPEDNHFDLKIRILQWLGVSLERQDILNMTQSMKQLGE